MNFKRGKKREKLVHWGSPKKYQASRVNPNTNPAKKRWPCKKLKGKHEFGGKIPHKGWNNETIWYEYRCIGCGKKKYDFESLKNSLGW